MLRRHLLTQAVRRQSESEHKKPFALSGQATIFAAARISHLGPKASDVSPRGYLISGFATQSGANDA
jgi:hypothetical protein